MRYMLLYEGHRLEVTEMSILEYTFEEFLEDTKQEQLEKEALRLQLEKERKEREAERKEKEAAIQAEREEKETAIFSLQRVILTMRKNNKSYEEIAQYTALDMDTVRKLAENEDDI